MHEINDETGAQVTALYARVHGWPATCGCCGDEATCSVKTKHQVKGLGGKRPTYGLCPTCSPLLAEGRLDGVVGRTVLDLAPASPLLEGMRVERFSAVPGPDRTCRASGPGSTCQPGSWRSGQSAGGEIRRPRPT